MLTLLFSLSGKLAEMGFGYEDCKKLNPKLIYASISGAQLLLPPFYRPY